MLAAPCGERVVRVCPFDPAYRLHVEACLRHPELRWFQRIDEVVELAHGGHAVLMERLAPAPEPEAQALCARVLADAPDPDRSLEAARRVIRETEARGRRQLHCWGGLDVRPGNVLRDSEGRSKLVDPYFVAGKDLIAALLEDAAEVARHYPPSHLASFLEIPPFADEDPPSEVHLALRRILTGLTPPA